MPINFNNKMLTLKIRVSIFLWIAFTASTLAQNQIANDSSAVATKSDTSYTLNPTDTLNHKRLLMVTATAGAVYIGGMVGLYQLWYKDYESKAFHFFNDNTEWKQMDKCGHAFSTYQIGMWSIDILKWTGLERKKAIFYGTGYAYLFQTTIEVFDGFSSGWGFSSGDVIANTIGAATVLSQELIWNEQRFNIKFSYHASPYANDRPNLLGENSMQRIIKDYNGQTYWLSANIACWLPSESRFPKWLNVAVGYGAQGMTGAHYNPTEINGIPAKQYYRLRQFYIAPDIDLTRIKTKSKTLKTIFKVVNCLKFPMPTLELNSNKKWVFYPVYF